MKNLHVIATDKPSRLHFDNKLFLSPNYQDSKTINSIVEGKNIYITSDDEIKEGDWCYDIFLQAIFQANSFMGIKTKNTAKKIILTTDQYLIADRVQAIDDEFLEWFVKNSSCEEVEVISFDKYHEFSGEIGYEIIIPKEELKQETLEEFIFKIPFDYNINPKEVIDMCMKEQQNIILTWRLGYFIDMINSLPDDTEKNRTLKSVFNNRDGELLLESYKLMKEHYEKKRNT